jgi:hypothetical protein
VLSPSVRSKNLRGNPKPYKFRSLGHMATLGRRHGIAEVAAWPRSHSP